MFVAGSGDPVRGVFLESRIGGYAWQLLEGLTNPDAREAVRQIWLEDPSGELKKLMANWFPEDPVTLFLLGDFDRYTLADPSGALLESARAEGDSNLRVHLATTARRGKRLGWAYRVAAVPENLLPEEWEAMIELLQTGDRKQYLWQLIDRAPLIWTARCLTALGNWRPTDKAAEHLVELANRYAEIAPTRTPFEPLAWLKTPPPRAKDRPRIFKATPDGSTLIGVDSALLLWRLPKTAPEPSPNTASGTATETSQAESIAFRELDGFLDAAISPDGGLLAAWSTVQPSQALGWFIAFWWLPGGEPAGRLTAPHQGPGRLHFTPDSTSLVNVEHPRSFSRVGRHLRTPKVWLWRSPGPFLAERARGKPLGRGTRGIAFHAASNQLAIVLNRTAIQLRRLPYGSTIGQFPVSRVMNRLESVQFLPDGETLIADGRLDSGRAASVAKQRIVVAQLPTGRPIAVLSPAGEPSGSLVTPDGQHLVRRNSSGLVVWRLPGCTQPEIHAERDEQGAYFMYAGVTPDSRLFVSSGSSRAELCELPAGRALAPIELGWAQLLPTKDGALLVGQDAHGATVVLRYRPSRLTELAERPIAESINSEVYDGRYDDPADAALAKLGAGVLTYLRRDRPRDL